MKLGLDVMGGDFAPQATIEGAILALQEISANDRIVLIGKKEVILSELAKRGVESASFDIVDAPDEILMGEKPTKALQNKPQSSIAIGFYLLKEKKIDAFASAGNTGAMMVGAMYTVGPIQGISRPCVLAEVPKIEGANGILLDVGTNSDCKPEILYHFGLIGNEYAKAVLEIDNPKIGLLNIGEEEEKGNLLCQTTFPLMKGTKDFNFVGNVESRDLFNSTADVLVCDGFVGNVIIKQIEGVYDLLKERGIKDEYISRLDYENQGGSPVLGVNGNVVVGHGISNGKAIKNMILLSKKVCDSNLVEKLTIALSSYTKTI